MENTTTIKPTGLEVMQHVLLFCYNWTQEDFQEAFADSEFGWEYHWNKLQRSCRMGNNSTEAVVKTILNMDSTHLQLLYNFIMRKADKTIRSARAWQQTVDKVYNEEESE